MFVDGEDIVEMIMGAFTVLLISQGCLEPFPSSSRTRVCSASESSEHLMSNELRKAGRSLLEVYSNANTVVGGCAGN